MKTFTAKQVRELACAPLEHNERVEYLEAGQNRADVRACLRALANILEMQNLGPGEMGVIIP